MALFRVTRDGKELFRGSHDECFEFIHKNQSQSVHWAISYEGWKIEVAPVSEPSPESPTTEIARQKRS